LVLAIGGPNHARVFDSFTDGELRWVIDLDSKRLQSARERFPNVSVSKELKDALNDSKVDCVVVVVPTSLHFQVVDKALDAGKHVLCEKPLTMRSAEAETLINKALSKNLTLMSGHIFLYNPGIMKLKDILDEDHCGPVQYIAAIRSNLGPFRYDSNSAWDLASHDLYIFSHLLGFHSDSVSCHGGYYLQKSHADVCFLGLRYKTNILGSIHVSWLSPTKVREIVVVCENKMIKWNELDSEGPIKIYHSSVNRQDFMEYGTFLLSAKTEDIIIPRVKPAEPLSLQNRSFLENSKTGKMPEDAGANPVAVIRQLEAADISLKENAQFINVNWK